MIDKSGNFPILQVQVNLQDQLQVFCGTPGASVHAGTPVQAGHPVRQNLLFKAEVPVDTEQH